MCRTFVVGVRFRALSVTVQLDLRLWELPALDSHRKVHVNNLGLSPGTHAYNFGRI